MEDLETTTKKKCPWRDIAVREIAKHGITPEERDYSIKSQSGYYMCSVCRSPNKTCSYSPDKLTKKPEPIGAI